ncbi:hypothetical protein Q644_03750 [Brucella intermedia 229E]|uniref:Uncharacterized protein n=1 Tax=Brucella intermedia 229E TaxID=1337887 RepID=U4V4Y7_9HYPH|nr:hypothetical protein Q644_03750 [Brucella intermedia 229E]
MGSHELLASFRQFLQEPCTNTGGLFRIMFETIVPIGMIKSHCENRITGECQAIFA